MEDAPVKKRSHHKKKPDPNGLMPTPRTPASPLDELLALADGGSLAPALMLMFWKQRFENPEFTMQLHPNEEAAFSACVKYLEVTPTIRVFRPGGIPAQEGSPAQGNRRAVPPRAAIPPKDYIVVQMVGADGNAFKPIENNQEDRDRQIKADAFRRIKDQARQIAQQLASDAQQGTFSTDTIGQAINALTTLAGQS